MSEVTTVQPDGTPTWIDLGIPDLDRAMEFYGALFGWEFEVGGEEYGRYTTCLLRGKKVAALMPNPDPQASTFWWGVYFAAADLDAAVQRSLDAGGSVVVDAMDVPGQGRMAVLADPTGAQFGLWQGAEHIGAELVNEPSTLLRNDLVTPDADTARRFYAAVFGFTLDADDNQAGADFTFLRRPDGHEIGGIVGEAEAPSSSWGTLFMVEDCDTAVERARQHGGSSTDPQSWVYGRIATITDPFGATFTVGSAPAG